MEINLLYNQYQDAIKCGDMDGILKYGKLYFTGLNNGTMTDEDKEHLQNDVLLCAAAKKRDE